MTRGFLYLILQSDAFYCTLLYCTVLHCTALYYNALLCIVLHCTLLHGTALHYITLHCTVLHCTTLHYTTLHYTTLYYTALHCTTLHYTALHCTGACNVLHYHRDISYLADPGKARGCSTKRLVITSVSHFFPPTALRRRNAQTVTDSSSSYKIDCFIVSKNFINPKGHQNPDSGSKVTAILLKGLT